MKIEVCTAEEVRSPVLWDVQINAPQEAAIFQEAIRLGLLNAGAIAVTLGLSVEGVDAVLGCFRDAATSTMKVVEEKLAAIALEDQAAAAEIAHEDQV